MKRIREVLAFTVVYLDIGYTVLWISPKQQTTLSPVRCRVCGEWADFPHRQVGEFGHYAQTVANYLAAYILYRVVRYMWTAK